jgi:hypothetical protein
LLAHGRWFSPGSPASSTTKTGRHDIAEILLKVALENQRSNQNQATCSHHNIGKKPPTMGKQLVNFIICGCESSAPFL